jgi:epoxyqueuosine reductase
VSPAPSSSLKERLFAQARALGFALVGVARAEPLGIEAERLRAWLAAGRHGVMGYMADSVAARVDPTLALSAPGGPGLLPSAKSVIVLGMPYARSDERVGPAPGRVARYARGRDYHNATGSRARTLAKWLRRQGHKSRATCDTMPIMERAWAERAGLGFIGKNCSLIVPGTGSHVVLATVLTSAVLEPDVPQAERCGSCALCLDACPTRAFVAPRQLDARRCISYLTIEEHRAPPEELRAPIGDWLFGCDACQDACPFNRAALPPDDATAAFANDARWEAHDAAALVQLDAAGFAVYAAGSPIQRAGRSGMARNAAIVLGNAGDRRHLPVLRAAAERDDDEGVRDAARWAVERLSGK